ncbi:LAMI_0F03620g1_1 [Lachancea mirantina]|uniref:Translation initiation factor eIF2B subunit gamma n=1 Tax=Lachancea mirantina TaxID=1230905 RepID=A0A1G4JXD0_9SACH|nr:LAMI_0F03620g1_1 [Lachancea mirantina]
MDFQVFIFCGKGYNLFPFTQRKDDSGAPKALLPIANRHMIEYVLDWCDQGGFKEINVLGEATDVAMIKERLRTYINVRESQYEILLKSIQAHHVQQVRKPAPINFIVTKGETTGEVLCNDLRDRITGDFVVLPCDFITDIPPQILIDQYRNKDSDNLAMAVYYRNGFQNIDKKHLKPSYIVYSENENSMKQPVLLDMYSGDDVERSKYLQIRTQLLWRYPNASVSKKLLDSFIYVCSYDIIKLISENENPRFPPGGESEDSDEETQNATQQSLVIKPSYFNKKNKLIRDSINVDKSLDKVIRDLARRSWRHAKLRETIGLFVLPAGGAFIRSNSLTAYTEANRYILRIKSSVMQSQQITGTNIGADSIVGPNCIVGERTSVKLSVLGRDTKIGKRCRIVGSVVLDGAIIDDESILENVIVGPATQIGKKSRLTNSYIEGSYIVSPKTVLKGETLTHIHLDEILTSEEMTDSTDDDESSGYTEEYVDDDEFEDDGLFER